MNHTIEIYRSRTADYRVTVASGTADNGQARVVLRSELRRGGAWHTARFFDFPVHAIPRLVSAIAACAELARRPEVTSDAAGSAARPSRRRREGA